MVVLLASEIEGTWEPKLSLSRKGCQEKQAPEAAEAESVSQAAPEILQELDSRDRAKSWATHTQSPPEQ